MIKFNLGLVVTGVVLGLGVLAASSSANAQCAYGGGYSYAPSYQYSTSYVPSYGYSTNYYAPTNRNNQGFYGRNSYDVRRDRVRTALTLAAVAGAAIAISNNNDRNRGSRNRSGGNRGNGNRGNGNRR